MPPGRWEAPPDRWEAPPDRWEAPPDRWRAPPGTGIPDGGADFGALDLATCAGTSAVTKERFDAQLASERPSRIETMVAMLERFDPATAARRNRSFRYFWVKHLAGAP